MYETFVKATQVPTKDINEEKKKKWKKNENKI